jgi:CO dehydrogenase/acetyl-CoA synthase beta subunit
LTFFTLLYEANKLDVYNKRWQLTVSAFPNMEKETQDRIFESLALPEDILDDILIEEDTTISDDFRKTLEGDEWDQQISDN